MFKSSLFFLFFLFFVVGLANRRDVFFEANQGSGKFFFIILAFCHISRAYFFSYSARA